MHRLLPFFVYLMQIYLLRVQGSQSFGEFFDLRVVYICLGDGFLVALQLM